MNPIQTLNKTQEYIDLSQKYGAHNYHPLPIVIEKAEGVWVTDVEGRKYLDMLSSYSALNHGHRHPRLIAAAKKQLDLLTLTSRAFHNDKLGFFYQELTELCEMDLVLPMNTGAEAVETALKAARKWGYTKKGVKENQAEIIACENNFHGRTITIISFSTEADYRENFGPFTPGFVTIPYGDLGALKAAINPNTVAFLVEPIQGEGGVVIPPQGYLAEAQKICQENNVLLILDEIQTGLGRTGKLFAYQHEAEKPDALILGKALGGGVYPVSAVVSSKKVLGVFRPGEHGSTFGGNPLGAAIAIEALKILKEENLAQKAAVNGQYFIKELKKISNPLIQEVRGKGLLIGLVLKKEAGGARQYCEKLMAEGLLCKETHEQVIRFAPPLVIDKSEIDWALERIYKVMSV